MVSFTGLPTIGAAQTSNAGTTSNDADAYAVDSNNAVRAETVDNTNAFAITNVNPTYLWEKHVTWRFTDASSAPTAQITVTVPASPPRGKFGMINATGQDMEVEVSGQPLAAPVIKAGESAVLSNDGTNVELLSSGSGVGAFLDLTDTPANYSGDALKYARVNGGETALEFTAVAPGAPVAVTPPFRQSIVSKTAAETGVDLSVGETKVSWNDGFIDPEGMFDDANDRIIIPAGVTQVRVHAQLHGLNADVDGYIFLRLRKNNTGFKGSASRYERPQASGSFEAQVIAPVVNVVESDYFELFAVVQGDSSIDIGTGSYLAVEVVQDESAAFPPEEVAAFIAGNPPTSSVLYGKTAQRQFTLADDLAGSKATARVAGAGATVFDVKRDGGTFGTLTFAASATVGTFATTGGGDEIIAVDERLTIESQGTVDGALVDIDFNLDAWRN